MKFSYLTVFLVFCCFSAQATKLRWEVVDARFANEATLSGTFVFDTRSGQVTNVDLVTSAGSGFPGAQYQNDGFEIDLIDGRLYFFRTLSPGQGGNASFEQTFLFSPQLGDDQREADIVESESVEILCGDPLCDVQEDYRFLAIGGTAQVVEVLNGAPLDLVLDRSPALEFGSITVLYEATTDRLVATGIANSFIGVFDNQYVPIIDGQVSLSVGINGVGNLAGQENRLTVLGEAEQVGATSGTLLTGRILEFGFKNSGGGSPWEFIVEVDGGDLESNFPDRVGLVLRGDFPSAFDGPFLASDRVRGALAPLIEGRVFRGSIEDMAGQADDSTVSVIDMNGLRVRISTGADASMKLRTYGVLTPKAFDGRDGLPNEPSSRFYVSGDRFISTNSEFKDGFNFEEANSIRFDFSSPVRAFGFSTVGLFDSSDVVSNRISMFAIAMGDDDLFDVDEHTRRNYPGEDGQVLPWVTKFSESLDVHVTLDGFSDNGSFGGYGLDDFFVVISEDSDQDGIVFDSDNCSFVANAAQRDTDGDGIGNACDADLNNDCIVNVVDLGILRLRFFSDDSDADFDGDGVVNVVDLGIMRSVFFESPGPSGVTTNCW